MEPNVEDFCFVDKFEDKSTVPIAAVLAGLGILVFGIGIGLFFFIRKFLGKFSISFL